MVHYVPALLLLGLSLFSVFVLSVYDDGTIGIGNFRSEMLLTMLFVVMAFLLGRLSA